MGILKKLKNLIHPEVQEWDVPTETYIHEAEIQTEDVSMNTQVICLKCGGKSYLKDQKCVKCDLNLV